MTANNTYMCEKTRPENMANMTQIILGDRPPPVQNFKCISLDFDKWKCTFDSNERISTTYKVEYAIDRHIYDCSCTKTNEHYECTAQLLRKTHDTYNFSIKSQNCFGSRKESFPYNIHEIVIPRDVYLYIRNENVSSTGVKFTWKIHTNNKELYEGGFLIKGKYKANYDKHWTNFYQNTTYNITSPGQLTKLLPHTNYTIIWRVRGKFASESEEMWKQVQKSFVTKPQKPIKSPTVDRGGFYIDNNQCAHIFWRAISKNKRNGTNFGYNLRITSTSGIISSDYVSNKSYYNNVCGEGDHTMFIWTINSEGSSPKANSIRIHIPGNLTSAGPPKPRDIRSHYNNEKYDLEWRPPDLSQQWEIVDYTISRCTSKTLSFELCEDPIRFIRVPANQTKITFPNRKSNLIFAVSANYKNHSSGMVLPLCIPHEKTPLRQINLIKGYITDSNMTVKWNIMCEERTLLTNYSLEYCAADVSTQLCKGPLTPIADIPVDETGYTLTNLTPYSYYLIRLQIRSRLMHSPLSQPLLERTAGAAPSAPKKARTCAIFADYAILEWERPSTPNGEIMFYEILINSTVVHEGPANTLYYNLTKLESWQTYNVQVSAINKSKLRGQLSEVVKIRTEGKEPGEVTSLIHEGGRSSVSVIWNEPREIYGPIETIQYEINYTRGEKWERIMTPRRKYELSCLPNQTLEFCVRAIQIIEHPQNNKIGEKCRHIKFTINNLNYSMYYGKWVCFNGKYCSSNPFDWKLSLLVLGVIVFMLLLLLFIFYKHKQMKTIQIVVPTGLVDIYESSREQNSVKIDRNPKLTGRSDESMTENLKPKGTCNTESPRLGLIPSSAVAMTHTRSDIKLKIQITNEETSFIQESDSTLDDSRKGTQMSFPPYIDPKSMGSILSSKIPEVQRDMELQEKKSKLQPAKFDGVSQPETKVCAKSYNIQTIPNTGYVSLNMTLTPRNNRKPQPEEVKLLKKTPECYEAVGNNKVVHCQILVHPTKTSFKVSHKGEITREIDDIAGSNKRISGSKNSTDNDIPDEEDRISLGVGKHSPKDDLPEIKSNGYVTMEGLSLLAGHRS